MKVKGIRLYEVYTVFDNNWKFIFREREKDGEVLYAFHYTQENHDLLVDQWNRLKKMHWHIQKLDQTQLKNKI